MSEGGKTNGTARRIEAQGKSLIRGADADLEARDPEFIRFQLPAMWLLATLYFRAEVRGLERIPGDGGRSLSPRRGE